MTTLADYTVIQDTSVSLPKDNGDIDSDFKFSAPGVDDGIRAVLMFRINPAPDPSVTLEMNLNGTSLLTTTFTTDPQRGWLEVVPSGVLLENGNILTLTQTGDGSVSVSDLVIFYQTAS